MTRHRGFVRFNQGVFSAFFAAFTLLFGVLYGLYRSERLFLYVAVYCGLLVPYAVIGGQFPFLNAPELLMPLVDAYMAFAVCLLLATLLILYSFFYRSRPRQFYGFVLLGLAATISVFVRLENAGFVLLLSVLVNVEVLRVVGVALWRRKRWAWIVGLGVAPSLLIQFWSQLELAGVLATPWSSSPFNPNMIGMLFLSSAFAAYVGIRFAEANRGLAAANRELSEINRTLEDRVAHRTAALQASQAQLIHTEKMASLGQLTSGIAHEIRNPLNFVNNFARLSTELTGELRQELEANPDQTFADASAELGSILDDLKINTENVRKYGQRADGIIRSMLDHARPVTGKLVLTDVNALLDRYLDLCYHGLCTEQDDFPVALEREFDEAVGEIEVRPQELGRVFFNLLNNAFQAVMERQDAGAEAYGPRISVSTRRRAGSVEIRIGDNGLGIQDALQEKVFEPFYTTRPAGAGTGLGLSLSHDIVMQGHGGTLTVESEQGQGATFIVALPTDSGK